MFAFDAKESVCGAGGISAVIAMHGTGYGLANPKKAGIDSWVP